MTQDHVLLAQWDAAYVLGALTSRDRQTYEEHLQLCNLCRQAVAELAPLAGLLSRASGGRTPVAPHANAVASDAHAVASIPSPGRTISGPTRPITAPTRPITAPSRRTPRRRRRRVALSALTVAAAVLTVFLCIPLALALRNTATTFAMVPVVDSPLSASVRLADESEGTRIWMECDYDIGRGASSDIGRGASTDVGRGASSRPNPPDYALVVTERNGDEHQLSTWTGLPGTTFRMETVTALDAAEIDTIDIRIVGAESPLLTSAFDG